MEKNFSIEVSCSIDRYNQPAVLTSLEKQIARYIKKAFEINGIDFDKAIRFRRRAQSYLSLIAPNDDDFCRIKIGPKSIWFSIDAWRLDEEKRNDARFNNIKNRKIRHWKVYLNCIEDFESNTDLIVDSYKSIDLLNTIIDESKIEIYDLSNDSQSTNNIDIKFNSVVQNEIIENYTVIDLETTGLSTKTCEIIELAAVKVRNNEIIDTYSTLIKPNKEIPDIVTQKTNITNEMVENAPQIDNKFQEYLDFIGDDVILGHNIDTYDLPILRRYCEDLHLYPLNNNSLDTLKFSHKCDIDVPDYKLTTLTKHFNIEHKNSHRALADCIANHECYQCLQEFYNPDLTLKCKSSGTRKYNTRFSDETKQLQELNVLVMEITCDNILTEDEILFLNNWLERNKHLSGNYPFDTISKAVSEVLEDGIITNEEKAFLLDVLSNFSNPVESYSENIDNVDLTAKQIVLTGDFVNGTKAEIVNKLEVLGAIVKSGVSSKTDYVIVGGYGSDNWACGNYGSKVKKALELQSKGKDVKIIKEEEFFKCLKETV